MFQSFLNLVFGCSHARTTFPLSPSWKIGGIAKSVANRHGTYVVCLDCGKEFAYNWADMRLGEPVNARRPAPSASYSPVNR